MIIERELYRHFHFVRSAKEVLYSNPKHIKGLFSYRDKKRLYDLEEKVQKKRQTHDCEKFKQTKQKLQKHRFLHLFINLRAWWLGRKDPAYVYKGL